jgi:hypothetical protein
MRKLQGALNLDKEVFRPEHRTLLQVPAPALQHIAHLYVSVDIAAAICSMTFRQVAHVAL